MAGIYRQIVTHFWNDPYIKKCTPEAKLVYVHLITNPRAHYSGIYCFPNIESTIAHETGLSLVAVKKALSHLGKDAPSIPYRYRIDTLSDVVFVRKMMRYQGASGSKVAQGVANHLETLHKSFLIKDFLDEYADWNIPYRYPITYPIEGVSAQEQEQEQEKEQKYTCASDKPDSREDVLFDQFWDAYPKRKAKGQAKKAWSKIKRPAETLEKILAALEWQTESDDWKKENGQFIPYPATYLNAESWDDDPTDDILTADDMRPVSRSM